MLCQRELLHVCPILCSLYYHLILLCFNYYFLLMRVPFSDILDTQPCVYMTFLLYVK